MPFVEAEGLGVILGACEATGVSAVSPLPFESPLIVEVEDDRPKVCVRGARCVSLSSMGRKTQSLLLKPSPPHRHNRGVILFLSEEGVARNRGGGKGDQLNILLVSFQDMMGNLRADVSRAKTRDRYPGCRPRCVEAKLPARGSQHGRFQIKAQIQTRSALRSPTEPRGTQMGDQLRNSPVLTLIAPRTEKLKREKAWKSRIWRRSKGKRRGESPCL